MKRKITTLLTILVLAALLTACGSAKEPAAGTKGDAAKNAGTEKITVKLAYLPITHALAIFEEKERLEQQNENIQMNW